MGPQVDSSHSPFIVESFPPNLAKRVLIREPLPWKKFHILQGHRQYRRDCRHVSGYGSWTGAPSSSLGVDIIQLGCAKDDVTGLDVKYALVGTALVPWQLQWNKSWDQIGGGLK